MDFIGIKTIQKFKEFFKYCYQPWSSFIIRTMLVKTKANSWIVYWREAVFDREKRKKLYSDISLFESQDIKVYETLHKMDDFESIWRLFIGENEVVEDGWVEGKVQVDNIIAKYKYVPQLIEQTPTPPEITKGYMSEFSFKSTPIIKDLNWPAVGIDLVEKDRDRENKIDREKINQNLRIHPSAPFIDINAVVSCYMNAFPIGSGRSRQDAVFCILAPIYLRFEKIALNRKKLDIELRVNENLKHDISIALMPTALNGRTMEGSRLEGKYFKIVDHINTDLLLKASCKFAQEVSYLRILPFIKDILIPAPTDLLYSESIPNLRAKIHQYWDLGNEYLIAFLRSKGKYDSDDFERAVAIVLHIAGYQIEHIGQFKGLLQKYGEVDIFAFSPRKNRVYAVECTLGPIEKKVGKIESQVTMIRTKIKKCYITPVIATSLPKKEIPQSTLQEAGKKGILVLDQNLLVEMLRKTEGNIRFFDFLENIARENFLKYMAH